MRLRRRQQFSWISTTIKDVQHAFALTGAHASGAPRTSFLFFSGNLEIDSIFKELDSIYTLPETPQNKVTASCDLIIFVLSSEYAHRMIGI